MDGPRFHLLSPVPMPPIVGSADDMPAPMTRGQSAVPSCTMQVDAVSAWGGIPHACDSPQPPLGRRIVPGAYTQYASGGPPAVCYLPTTTCLIAFPCSPLGFDKCHFLELSSLRPSGFALPSAVPLCRSHRRCDSSGHAIVLPARLPLLLPHSPARLEYKHLGLAPVRLRPARAHWLTRCPRKSVYLLCPSLLARP
jgi:hypothetical protein